MDQVTGWIICEASSLTVHTRLTLSPSWPWLTTKAPPRPGSPPSSWMDAVHCTIEIRDQVGIRVRAGVRVTVRIGESEFRSKSMPNSESGLESVSSVES